MKFDGCNCDIEIKNAYYRLGNGFNKFPDLVEVRIEFFNQSMAITVPPVDLTAKELMSRCGFLRFTSSKDKRKFDTLIVENLCKGLDNGTIEKGYAIDKTGAITMPNGNLIFARGAELIGSVSRPVLLDQRFQGIRLLGNGSSLTALLDELINAPFQVLLVFAYVMFASVRSVLVGAGIDFQGVLYIEGEQGKGKTTLAKRVAAIYEKDDKPFGVIQADSTSSSVNNMMADMRDQAIIVDDLCYSSSSITERKRTDLAAAMVRQATSTIVSTKMHGKEVIELPSEASLILTAEFSLSNMSDLTRCIIVSVNKKLELSEDLQPTLVGDAVRLYSEWFSEHAEDAIQIFHKAVDDAKQSGKNQRVETNYACMRAAMDTFLHCASDCGEGDSYSESIRNGMECALDEARKRHKELIHELKMLEPEGNLAYCILKGYKSKQIKLVDEDDVEKLNKASVDGVKWKKDICLKKASILRLVHAQPGYKDWNRMEIINELNDMGALYINETDRYTVKIVKGLPRVYRIRKDVLKELKEKY